MDFPADVTTNIHVINDVEAISWEQWSCINQQLPKYADDSDDNQLAIIALVHSLRENSAHVHYDAEEQRVWLFRPLASLTTDAPGRRLALEGLSRVLHGTLAATDLRYPGLETFKVDSDRNNVFSAVAEHRLPSENKVTETLSIYAKAMLAISASLTHHLVKTHGWIPLGISTCIMLPSSADQPFVGKWPDPSIGGTTAIQFQSIWDVTGQLKVSSNLSRLDRLCSIARRKLFTNQELALEAPILLSPSGVSAKYHGMLDLEGENASSDAIADLKSKFLVHLNNGGIYVSDKAEWALVKIPTNHLNHSGIPSEANQATLTIWPAEYVIYQEILLPLQTESLEAFDHSEIVDPLARAEAWYLGRAVRLRELEAVRHEAEVKNRQELLQQELTDVDVASVAASPIFREAIPQDVSGIYPTPPDGLQSQISGTPVSNSQQDASPTFVSIDQTNDTYNNPSYSDGTNHDIFADMDVVDETDFNFFDDPGMESGEDHGSIQDAPSERNLLETEAHDRPSDLRGKCTLDDNHNLQESPAFVVVPKNETKSSARHTEEAIIIEGAEFPSKTRVLGIKSPHSNTSPPTLGVEPGARKISPPPQLLRDVSPSGEIVNSNRGSFNSISLANLEFDSKYGVEGRFRYPLVDATGFYPSLLRNQDKQYQIPTIGLQPSSKASSDSEDDDDTTDEQPTSIYEYDINQDLREMGKPSSRKHKRTANGSVTDPATPTPQESALGGFDDGTMMDFSSPSPALFTSVITQSLKTSVFHPLKLPRLPFGSHEQSFIQVAQLVAEQIALETTSPFLSPEVAVASHPSQVEPLCQEIQTSVISGVFPSADQRTLIDLVGIGDQEVASSPRFYKLEVNLAGIQRMGSMTDILPSAIPFWEELSLSPSSGAKDIDAFYVFPMKDYLVRPSKTFLEMIKGAYQACNLGRHANDVSQSTYPHGLVPIPTYEGTISKETKASCVKLGKHLAGLRLCGGNFIIYMLDDSDDYKAVPELCAAFFDLFQAYRSALDDQALKNPNDVVLQIVPVSMVFARDKIVLPSPADYKRLAFQVYDRCGPISLDGQDQRAPFMCAPAIRLAKPVPKSIGFKLTPDPSSALLDTEDCIHLAYKWEIGQQWLTVSWTNNFGTLQWNAAYWLSKDEDVRKSFAQAAMAIWETTTAMLPPRRHSCRVFVVKDGLIEKYEIEAWTVSNSEKALPFDLTLLKIEPNPSLVLFPLRTSDQISELPDVLATPVSTPHTTGLSPEVSTHVSTPGAAAVQGAAPTPIGENDADTRLIDITDETWAAIISSGAVDFSRDPLNPNLELRGYLIRRAGPKNQDGLLLIHIDVVHSSKAQQSLLKEVLGLYRNLASLARVRNVIDQVKGTLPIHVVSAKKAHAALCKSMRYGE